MPLLKTSLLALTGTLAVIGLAQPAAAAGCASSSTAMAVHNHEGGKKDYAKTNIVETAKSAGKFNTLLAAAEAAGLVDTLTGEGPLTVFAPTDEAFKALPEGTVESLLKPENRDKLAAILKYHVVPGKVKADKVVGSDELKSALGQYLDVTVQDDAVSIAGANIIKTDIKASNGVIHVIDAVMLPQPDLAETATAAGKFNTLLAAAEAAGLTDALKADGQLTIFAPTDAAFAALPEGTVEELLKPENSDKLAAILKYHVVAGRHLAADVITKDKIETLQGSEIKIAKKDGSVKVNKANITATDIKAGNGVIHVIDAVLIPSE